MKEIDVFVTGCFTEQGCKDYINKNGHNLNKPFIYAFGSYRNDEYQIVRKFIMQIPETPATSAALAAIQARTERNENLMRFVVEVFNIAAQHCTLNRDEIHNLGQSLGLFASKEFGQETHWQLDGIFQDNSCGHAVNHDKSIGIEMFANFCREKAVSSKTSYARSFWSKCGFQASIYAKKLREAK